MTPIADTPVKIIEHALHLIKTRGWNQGAYARKNGEEFGWNVPDADSYCLSGALMQNFNGEDSNTYQKAIEFVRQAISDGFNLFKIGGLIDWNDAPHRTVEEVIDVLELALVIAKNANDNNNTNS